MTLDEARPWIKQLIEAGMFVDSQLLEQALGAVGEYVAPPDPDALSGSE